ncbi:MAG: UDP-glucose 4-epimerase GalE [Patescibacteria group bacterium]
MNKGKILITGGAGYIGSHLVKNLIKEGYLVLIVDNLSCGFIEPLEIIKREFGDFVFVRGDLGDKEKLQKIFQDYQIDTVIHLAAKIDATESVKKPELYHQENYLNSINLLEAMTNVGVDRLIFSSTAAVYGNPQYTPIDENHPTISTNPYGQTKLDFEKYLQKTANLNYCILRYFNVGGSDPAGLIGKSHLQNEDLLENIIKVALGKKRILQIFGSDYETQDGTAIRDFLHVEDIAQAHILALNNVEKSHQEVFNIGSEKGFSVKEIIDRATMIFGKEIPTEVTEKRPGDIAVSVASSKKAKDILGWNPQYSDLDSIIRTDWNWRKIHPNGYLN